MPSQSDQLHNHDNSRLNARRMIAISPRSHVPGVVGVSNLFIIYLFITVVDSNFCATSSTCSLSGRSAIMRRACSVSLHVTQHCITTIHICTNTHLPEQSARPSICHHFHRRTRDVRAIRTPCRSMPRHSDTSSVLASHHTMLVSLHRRVLGDPKSRLPVLIVSFYFIL
jgi:hypothetical protein